jgi:hypothetical protein
LQDAVWNKIALRGRCADLVVEVVALEGAADAQRGLQLLHGLLRLALEDLLAVHVLARLGQKSS